MATNENLIPIPGRLHSVATEGHVAGADEIYDDSLQKTQDVINQEIDEVIDDVALIDTTESSPAVVPGFDPQTDTVHVTAQTLSESQKAQVRNNIGLGDVDAKISQAVASEASQRAAAVSAEATRAQGVEATKADKSDTYTKAEVNNIASAFTSQKYVTVEATEQTTSVTDVLPSTGQATDTVYRVAKWDGSSYNTAYYTEYTWNGSAYIFMDVKNVGIDDVPTAGSNNLVKSGGVAEMYGYYEENPEFLEVKYDKSGKLLEATRQDATKMFFGDIIFYGKDKGLVPLQYIQESDNPEFVAVLLDKDERIIEGISQEDGRRVLYAGIPVQIEKKINKSIDDILNERSTIIADYNRYNLLNNVTCVSNVVDYKCASAPNSIIDKFNATCYTIYLSSKTEYGEPSSDISVLLSVFNIAEPNKAENYVVAESGEGWVPNMVNVIDNGDYVRCLFVNMVNSTYCFRDFSKSTKEFGNITTISYNSGNLDLQSVTDYLENEGYSDNPNCIIMVSPWAEYNGYKYGTLTTNESHPILIRTNDNCSSIEFVSVIPDSCAWESILAIVGTRFYATIRRGEGFLYHSDDGGQTWVLDNIFDVSKISQQRPQLISYNNELYIVHSLWEGGRNDRIWGSGRDNVIIYKYNGTTLEKLEFLQNDNGIVYPNVFCFNGILYMIFSCSDLYREIETSITLRDRPQGKDLLYLTKLFNI